MVTAERAETKPTKTVKRLYLLQLQARNLLSRTTDISQNTLEQIDKGLSNQWIRKISVYGLDGNKYCHVGLELTIDWQTYSLLISVWGETLPVKQTVFRENNLAPEVQNAIAVFNQAVIEECLRTEWRVVYPKGLDWAYIDRELGFSPCPPLTWAGKVEKQAYPVPELPELTVTFSEAVPEEVRAESPASLPEKDERKDQGLFDQIKFAFG
jgi:hypothetical protein